MQEKIKEKELFPEVELHDGCVIAEGEAPSAVQTALVPVDVRVEPLCEVEKKTFGARLRAVMKEHFSAPRIAYMAIFTALAFVVTFLEFPIFPQASFLKLDFANVFYLIEGFIFGPVEAFVSILIKELLCFAKTSTGGVGELANLILSTGYMLIPAIAYRFKRGRGWAALYLVCACLVQMGLGLLTNRYINFPFFFGQEVGVATFNSLWTFILAFNAIKGAVIGAVVLLVYKPLARFIRMTTARFDRRMAAAKGRRKHKKNAPPRT